MELRQLEYFLACTEHGTFTAAAKSLNVVQSAVSTAVAKLEREVGARLFDRTRTVLLLTDAGRAAITPAREAIRASDEVRHAIAGIGGDVRGDVTLGALVNIGGIDLAGAFATVQRRHPHVAIAMRQSPQGSAGNILALHKGALDLALLGGPHDEPPGITVYPLASEPLVLVCAPDHPLAGTDRFSAADLDGERTIDYPPGWGTRTVVDRELPARRSVIEVADQTFGIQLALSGFGVTLVPESMTASLDRASVVHAADRDLTWRVAIAHTAGRSPTTAARVVLDTVLEICRSDAHRGTR